MGPNLTCNGVFRRHECGDNRMLHSRNIDGRKGCQEQQAPPDAGPLPIGRRCLYSGSSFPSPPGETKMIVSVAILVAGLVLLLFAGELLVKGAVGISEKMGISPLVIGLTVVAFGTSAPELLVSLQAALSGSPGIAVGNVVGSNIANVLVVLGLPALISPIDPRQPGLRRNMTVMVIVTVIFMWLLSNGFIGRLEGAVLVAALGLFIAYQVRQARAGIDRSDRDIHDDVGETPQNVARAVAYLAAGLVGLPIAAQMTVHGATEIARAIGISEVVIGLTIVSVGTSLPELATTLTAAMRRQAAVAIGNVVGSNIFNIAGIMGVTALISPVPVEPRIVSLDMWVMFAVAMLLAILGYLRIESGRVIGAIMLAAYVAYLLTMV